MKTASQDLFEFIKSLTKSEKQYYKKHTKESKEHDKAYLKLFDAIDKSKTYIESELIRQLGYTNKPKAFAVLKNYLYHELIKVITSITDTEQHKPDAFNQLQQLNFLANKGLFSQYTKLWNKSYKDAEEKELFQVQFLLRNQMHNLKMHFYLKTSQEELKQLIRQDEAFDDEYEALQRIKNLFRTIQVYNNQSQIRLLDTELADLKALQQNSLLTRIPKFYSFHYYYYFHFSHALTLYLTHDYANAFTHLEKIKNNMLRNQNLVLANPHLNMEFISVYYLVSFLQKQYNSFFAYIKTPFIEKMESKQHKAFIFGYWANSQIRYLISNALYGKAKEHIAKTEQQQDLYFKDMPVEIKQLLLCSLSIANFIIGNYHESFSRIKECTTTFQVFPKQDIQRSIFSLSILVAYELKNKRLLNNECETAYQFFYRKKITSKFEVSLISFFRKMVKSNYGRLEQKEKFKQLREDLEPIKKDPIQAQVFRYFNFYGWVQSKELGLSYMDYVKNEMHKESQAVK
jgi:hypothetical protein